MGNQPKSPSVPKKQLITKYDSAKKPDEERKKSRLEAAAYLFLTIWVLADVFVDYGHARIAAWAFYIALAIPLVLLAYHTKEGWPAWVRFLRWGFIIVVVTLLILLPVITSLGYSGNLVARLGQKRERLLGGGLLDRLDFMLGRAGRT